MNGIETDKIKEFDPDIPVVMLFSQDKIDVAVVCTIKLLIMVKSETSFLRLQKNITAFHFERIEKELNWYMARM
jgi:hypothetical protein